MSIFTTLLSTAVMAAATVEAPVTHVRVHDVEASYVRSVAADGTVTLSGQDQRTGIRFRFIIRGDKVRGWYGNRPVSFPLAEARGAIAEDPSPRKRQKANTRLGSF